MAAVLPAFWQAMPTTRPGYVSPPDDAATRAAVLEELGEATAWLKVIANAAWAAGDYFMASLLNVLSPMELLRRVPWIRRRSFASDATGEDSHIDTTPSVMAVADFTAATWYAAATHEFFDKLMEKCGRSDDKFIVYIAELLPILALACQRAGTWSGEIVVAVTDNDNCQWAINRRRSRNRYARYLLQILTLLEVKFRFRLVAYYVNTHNNVLNDTISRVFDAASATAIEDTQEVIDKMVTGLEYESLDEMITFFTSSENAMMHYALPGDSAETRAATLLTPFGHRSRAAVVAGARPAPRFTRQAMPTVFEHCCSTAQVAWAPSSRASQSRVAQSSGR